MKRFFLILALLGFSLPAFAAGGTCPSASTYMEPAYGATTGTLASFGVTSCFFIDFTNGVDTNTGTDESHPWLHAPGMTGCSNTCSSTTPTAGEGFIFMGGETWTCMQTAFCWTWAWSGNSSNPIYLGYDPSWFAGGSWSRPVISSGGVNAACPTSPTFTCSQQFKTSGGVVYVDIDNFEWTGMYNTQASGSTNVCAMCPSTASGSNLHVYENYFHGANVAHDGAHDSHFIYWGTSGNDGTSTVHHNVLDNRDGTIPPSGTSCGSKAATLSASATCTMTGLEGGPRQIFLNYFGYFGGSSLVVDNPIDFHNNTIEWQTLSPDNGTDHENMFESNGETGSGMVMYNNLVQHGWNAGVVDFQMGPNSVTSYAFNNVLPDMDGGNMQQMYEGNNASGNITYWFNNSAEGGPEEAVVFNSNSNPPSADCGRSTGSLNTANIINQHCVTTKTGTTWWSTGGTNNFTTNLAQSLSTASGQGYTNGNATPYALFPPAGGSTVGTGTNETSLCTTIGSGATTNSTVNAAAAAACLQDTSYGAAYNATSHTITGVGRPSTVARPSSAAWDIGAFQFAPQPPTVSGSLGNGAKISNGASVQ